MYNIPAVIFAGGKSSRMGKDKALLPFRDAPSLSQYQYQRLSKVFEHVYLSTKKNKFDFSCQIILDHYAESAPLIGILSSFDVLHADAIFILSVDAPLINEAIIQTLMLTYEKNKTYDAIIAKSPKGVQPLCAIYTKSILPLARQYFKEHNYKLHALLDSAHTKTVIFPDEEPFSNVNTPQEYKLLLSR